MGAPREIEVAAPKGAVSVDVSAAPQDPQNLTGSFGVPHAGQRTASGRPHSPQKRRPAEFSAPQFEQIIW